MIFLYARAWVIWVSFVPCMLNSGWIEVSRSSHSFFWAPISASLSASSFPLLLLWPFTHLKDVMADLFLRWYAVALKRSLFAISIQP